MKKGSIISTKLLLAVFAFFSVTVVNARMAENQGDNKGGTDTPTPAAGCSPAAAVAIIEFNNVRARLETTGGTMFQDRGLGIAAYYVPKQNDEDVDPLYAAVYAAGLWIGGVDGGGQLKVAAAMFRSGNDFWPGPLDDLTSDVDPETCQIFDQYFSVSRAEVNAFVAWHADPSAYPDYQIPASILNYPAKGNTVTKQAGQSYYVSQELAPFFDVNGNTFYEPLQGDYPKYDLIGDVDCRVERDIRLFGDTTIWFVFNDKGNVHTESLSELPIGMEVHGQAFAFATNDEINDMTFYNYELINKSSFTFTETYFGQWVDSDLGNYNDDFVGCDAQRGLGYVYNGDNEDEDNGGISGYGKTPPALGVDFFEGPYADNDGMDNPLTENVQNAIDSNGIPYSGLGIGYGDGIVDNERYGMRKFVYYNSGAPGITGNGDPQVAQHFYDYLSGRWLNGSGFVWGGDGNPNGTGHPDNLAADLIFPGDSDPLFWSTKGIQPPTNEWSEYEEGNTPADRRFLQSAGPFTLEPGAINDLTVGFVYARAETGDNLASVTYLEVADDKAQALFDNCFKVLDGPNTPDVTIQELDRELILFLSNNNPISNNFNEQAHLKDATISIPDTIDGVYQGTDEERDTLKYYDFQGYQIYQVKTSNITANQLTDPSVARLIAQVDKDDNIAQIVNYEYDKTIGANVPTEMVAGENRGIKHSFRVTTDAFATGSDPKLVNHKSYHFIVMAYAYNNWKTVNPQNFEDGGQLKPYLASRTNSTGGSIVATSAIPHSPIVENGGTILNSQYGDQPQITRIEGQGNGGNDLRVTASTEIDILANGVSNYPVYQAGFGPIEVKVVDPLNVAGGTYIVQFLDSTDNMPSGNSLDDGYWRLIYPSLNGFDTVLSDVSISESYEQLFLDQGLSVTLSQVVEPGVDKEVDGGVISASVEYPVQGVNWLGGLPDRDGESDINWIRSGIQSFNVVQPAYVSAYNDYSRNDNYIDPNEMYESILDGAFAPYPMVSSVVAGNGDNFNQSASTVKHAPAILTKYIAPNGDAKYYTTVNVNQASTKALLSNLSSVDIVLTSDKSKWTRSAVFETGIVDTLTENGAKLFDKRAVASVDKNFAPDGTIDAYGNASIGLSWFPGYAINVETGERLNIAFGEDSGLPNENGRDMQFNPSSRPFNFDPVTSTLDTVMGGRHYLYIIDTKYDESAYIDSLLSRDNELLSAGGSVIAEAKAVRDYFSEHVIWTGIPMLNQDETWLSTDVRVSLRVQKPYKLFETANSSNATPQGNEMRPMYQFTMEGFKSESGVSSVIAEALDEIRAVPNPYYAYSSYETGKLDTKMKITNLPEECTISIYNVSGTLMRRFVKADPKTSLDWDIKNHVGIPVAGGVYLIHIDIPNVGEKIIKWYAVTRPTDLGGF